MTDNQPSKTANIQTYLPSTEETAAFISSIENADAATTQRVLHWHASKALRIARAMVVSLEHVVASTQP